MSTRAFTLVEALVCMTLLTVVGLLMLTLFPPVLAQQKQLAYRAMAKAIASQEMAEAQTRELLPGTYPLSSVPLADGTTMSGQLEVQSVSGHDVKNLRELRVRISWRERGLKLSYLLQKRIHRANF